MNGIGLGLVICKLIVSKFNGHINFISKYGKGTTFYFTFQVERTTQSDIDSFERKKQNYVEYFDMQKSSTSIKRVKTTKSDKL